MTFDIVVIPLDLKRTVALERFEFTVELVHVSEIHKWIHQTLQTITSPRFNKLVIWILHMGYPQWGLLCSVDVDGWKEVDASLSALAGRHPDFRVVFRGDFAGDFNVIRHLIESDYLPRTSLRGSVMFEQAPNVENRFWKFGFP